MPVVEVAARDRVSHQSVHTWVERYREDGLAGLADRLIPPRPWPAARSGPGRSGARARRRNRARPRAMAVVRRCQRAVGPPFWPAPPGSADGRNR
ncbi:leucine zipper domain-containing protein [Nocardia sp. NBC_01009]|nr:leucine zipper domain-containing protein [Nocardia sp. NBC_01009]